MGWSSAETVLQPFYVVTELPTVTCQAICGAVNDKAQSTGYKRFFFSSSTVRMCKDMR